MSTILRIAAPLGALALVAACGQQKPAETPAQGASAELPIDKAAVAARSKPIAQEFQASLKGQLQAAMKAGGPMQAVDVCRHVAPEIARQQSEASGAVVRRVAAKNRNPDAAVDASLQPYYDELDAQPTVDGKPARRIWRSGEGEAERVNFLSAIPMQAKPCSVCHGTDVDPKLEAHIMQLYPGDLATGFKPGEMRGALLVSWPAKAFESEAKGDIES